DRKDLVDGKLARLLKSSEDLENIIKSQRSEKVKEGLGYNAVPPPAADLYLSPKKDLSWTGLPEFMDDTVTDYSRHSPTVASTSAEDQNNDTSTSEETTSTNPFKPFIKFVKPKVSQPESKIEEHETPKKPQVKNSEQNRQPSPTVANTSAEDQNNDTSTSEETASINPSKAFIKFIKPKESQPESMIEEQETPKKPQVKNSEQNRQSNRRPKGNQRNWNNLKSYQLGEGSKGRQIGHSYKSSTHRSAGHRPNGAHMRPPLRSSGPKPHGNSMRPPFRSAGHKPHGPSMNPRRPTMNGARPYKTFFQTPSFETRPFLKSSSVNNSYRAP
nr:hypothetical protein [Tanacetum cinerariifolium]